MLYSATEAAKILNISAVTCYAKFKLPEIKGLVIKQGEVAFIDEKGIEAVRKTLKYNQKRKQDNDNEGNEDNEIEILKDDVIAFLKEQLVAKDNQIETMQELFKNNQVLFKQELENSKSILALPEIIKEHDIELVNDLHRRMDETKVAYEAEVKAREEAKKNDRGFFKRLIRR